MGSNKATSIAHFSRAKGAALILAVLFAIVPVSEALAQADTDIHGYLSTKYRMRQSEDESDQDLYQYLALDLGDPLSSRATAHLFGRVSADLDGHQDEAGFYIFDSVLDTYDSPYNGRLYYAYLDLHRIESIEMVRLGRQLFYEAPITLYFDGARVETAEYKPLLGLKLGAYGGVPVHLYEPDLEGNVIYGAFVQTRPWPGARVQLHFTHAENDYIYGMEKNDFWGLSLWQAVNQYLQFNALYTMLEGDPRDLTVRSTLVYPAWDLIVQGSYYELLETQKFYSIEFDPFYAPLAEYYPYWQASLLIYKGLGENLAVEGGLDGRKLKDESNEGLFNHEFLRYFLALYLRDLPVEGMEASVMGERWESYTRDDEIQSLGGELSYEREKKFKLTLGTDWELYQYDYYFDTERDEVRSYYARLRYRPVPSFRTDLKYRFEDDDLEDVHWLELGASYEFGTSDEK